MVARFTLAYGRDEITRDLVEGVFMIVASMAFLLAREARAHRPVAAQETADPADARRAGDHACGTLAHGTTPPLVEPHRTQQRGVPHVLGRWNPASFIDERPI